MKTGFNIVLALGGIFALFMVIGTFMADWERPPVETEQIGYRGVGTQQVVNPRTQAREAAALTLPTVYDPAPPGGRPAREAYQNVQILGDLTEDEFNRVMVAITEWVAPEAEGCAYCHNLENLAEDVPTKIISRRMFQMTRTINENWTDHVAQTGVTCYTCHRGQPVPGAVWFEQGDSGPTRGMAGYDAGQNHPALAAGLTSLPSDPFSGRVDSASEIRVVGKTALPSGQGASIKDTEATYALMIHMSEALGVNCTFCHNSRSFISWEQSNQSRLPAWHGIQMVRDINQNYVVPLKPLYAANRLGPQGDAPKANCATCHRGQSKPLGGAQLARDYPELNQVTLIPPAGPPVPAQQSTAQ
jgi:photosynthetic reaction center cytochrome c subunit